MQFCRLRHVHGQHEIYEQIINIPVEVNIVVNLLPRQVGDDHAITVQEKNSQI